MSMQLVLHSLRLRLDALRGDDAPALFACRADPEVARYQGWQPENLAAAEAFIAAQQAQTFAAPDSWCQWAIRERESGQLLGDLGAHFPAWDDGPLEFGVTIQPAAQGRGLAREAVGALMAQVFDDWNMHRVIASVDPRNTASVALCRSLGMRQEAHHVESCRDGDGWADDLVFAMLAREWESSGHR